MANKVNTLHRTIIFEMISCAVGLVLLGAFAMWLIMRGEHHRPCWATMGDVYFEAMAQEAADIPWDFTVPKMAGNQCVLVDGTKSQWRMITVRETRAKMQAEWLAEKER